jgi:phosphate transport system permease protein
MPNILALLMLVAGASVFFFFSKRKVQSVAAAGGVRVHSLPHYYGWVAALWLLAPALAVWLLGAIAGLPSLFDHRGVGWLVFRSHAPLNVWLGLVVLLLS